MKRGSFRRALVVLPLAALATLVYCSGGDASREEGIYGLWTGEHGGRRLAFRFGRDGKCELRFEDEPSAATLILQGNFEVDFSKDPTPLTIRNIPQLPHPLHTAIEFTSGDSIRIAPFATRWRLRPISFDRDESLRLRRAENSSPPWR